MTIAELATGDLVYISCPESKLFGDRELLVELVGVFPALAVALAALETHTTIHTKSDKPFPMSGDVAIFAPQHSKDAAVFRVCPGGELKDDLGREVRIVRRELMKEAVQ